MNYVDELSSVFVCQSLEETGIKYLYFCFCLLAKTLNCLLSEWFIILFLWGFVEGMKMGFFFFFFFLYFQVVLKKN